MSFDVRGDLVVGPPPIIMPSTIKLLPMLLCSNLFKYREAVMHEYDVALTNGTLLNWGHDPDVEVCMRKIIFQVSACKRTHIACIHNCDSVPAP
jgi:hypothetical protein